MRSRIPDTTIDEVARRVDIVELVGRYVTLERKGQRYMGLCPFHSEKTPSFSVDPEAGLYYCFGCQRGGGVYKFVMEMEGLSFPEAVRQLGEEVGVEIAGSEEDDESNRVARALGELYNRVARTFVHFLGTEEGAQARQTLREREISDETIERFGIGYARRDAYWLHGFLTRKGYSQEFLQTSGLFTRANPRRALFAGRIMFPIRSHRGDVLAFGGRIMAGDGPKYINSPETPIYRKRESLFGIDVALKAIRQERHVVLAEGYMDVIALHQAGVGTAVAPLGTSFTEEQGRFLSRYIDRATLLFDADEAGARATRRAAEILEPHGITASVSVLDEGTDPADLLRERGSQAVLNAVSSPLTVLEFLVRQSL
ncbi:MAG: DNA primase, partial [Spirochaetota bacterium]